MHQISVPVKFASQLPKQTASFHAGFCAQKLPLPPDVWTKILTIAFSLLDGDAVAEATRGWLALAGMCRTWRAHAQQAHIFNALSISYNALSGSLGRL